MEAVVIASVLGAISVIAAIAAIVRMRARERKALARASSPVTSTHTGSAHDRERCYVCREFTIKGRLAREETRLPVLYGPGSQALLSRLSPSVQQGGLDDLAHAFCRAVFKYGTADGERDMRQTLSDGYFDAAEGLFNEYPYLSIHQEADTEEVLALRVTLRNEVDEQHLVCSAEFVAMANGRRNLALRIKRDE